MQKNNFILKFYLLFSFVLLASWSIEAQTITMSFPSGFDNCANPLPNAGNYTVSGTVNGKNEYTKAGGNPRVRWTGSQWEWQADDPTIGGINFITCWFNTNNTTTPPADCWQASFGCFLPVFSGAVTPTVDLSTATFTPSISNVAAAGTASFILTLQSALPGLNASNFSLTTNGTVSGASISSVTTGNNLVWTITVSVPTGDGTVAVNMININGTGGAACGTFPTTTSYVVNNTTTTGTALSAGDIAFTGYNSSSTTMDDFVFVVLRSGGLPSGTQIYFTDDSYGSVAGELRPGEGLVLWQATSNIPQFTQVIISSTISPASYAVTTGSGTSTATAIQHTTSLTSINLSNSGDQLFALQGNTVNPTYIAGIHMNAEAGTSPTNGNSTLAGWDDLTTGTTPFTVSATRSAIPPSLTNGTNAVMAVNGASAPYTEFDNAIYNCTGSVNAASISALRASINDRANWNKQDLTAYTFPAACTFSIVVPCVPPSITTAASSNSPICPSATLNLSVTAAGTAPLTYAWTGTGSFTNGATATPSVTGAATGNYQVTVTNACGNVSSTAAVTVRTLPSITTAASSNSPICPSATLNLSVTAAGTAPLSYAWTGTGTFTNGSTATPSVTGAATGNYQVTVTNVCGSVNSTAAVVVNSVPTITTAASSNSPICPSATLNLSVGAAGTAPLSYAWTGTGTFTNGTTATPSVTGAATGNYQVTVSNACGSVNSTAAVTVRTLPSITTAASSNSPICPSATLNLSVGAAGTAPLSYAWTGTGTFTNGTTATPSVTGAATGNYQVTVTNVCGSVNSTAAVVVNSVPTITTAASSNSPICPSATLNLNVGAAGTAPLSYAWTGTGTFTNGSTATPSVTGAATGNYQVTVTNACGSVNSTAAVVVNSVPTITTAASSNSPICPSATLNLSVGAAGTAPLSYAWTGTGTFTNGSTATPSVTGAATGNYQVTVSNACGSVNSTAAVVVNSVPTITTAASSNSPICAGNPLNLSVAAAGTAPLSYAWTGTGTFTNGSTATPTVTGATTGNYQVTVSNACGSISSTAAVTVDSPPSITTAASSNSPICPSGTLSLSVAAAGTAPLSYAWTGTGTFTNGSTATPSVTGAATGNYQVTVTNLCGNASSTAAVTVDSPPSITTAASSNSPICIGGVLHLSVVAVGTAPLSYAWTGIGTFTNGNTDNPSVTGVATGNYEVTVTNVCGSTTSLTPVIVNTPPTITTASSSNSPICSNVNLNLSVTAAGSAPLSYAWTGTGTFTNGNTDNPTVSGAASGLYEVTVSNSCGAAVSNTSVVVNDVPSIVVPASSNSPICHNGTLTLSVTAAGFAPLSYGWTGTGTFTNGNTASPSVSGAASGNYEVTVTNSCGTATSIAPVTVIPLQTAPTISFLNPLSGSNSLTTCSGTSITLTSPTANAYEYLWYKNGTPVFYAVSNPNYTFLATGNSTDVYTLAITYNGISCLSAVSTPLTITNQAPPATVTLSGPSTFCASTPSTLTANLGAGYTYIWKRSATIVQSGASNTYNPTASGNHNVTVTDLNGCSKVSTWTSITVNPLPTANAGLDKNVCNGTSTQIGVSPNAAYSYAWSPSVGLSNALIANPMATPSGNTTYTVTVTNNTTLCTNTDAVNVTLLTAPATPTLSSTATPICEGSTISLTPTTLGATSVDWFKNGVLLYNKPTSFIQSVTAPSPAGDNYTVKNKDANGCYSPSSNAVNAWVKDAPQPTITSVPAAVGANINVCVPGGSSGTATLTASSVLPATYSWRLAGAYIAGANTNTITSTVTTLQNNKVYNAEATYTNGCARLSANRNVKLVTSGCVPRLGEDKGGDLIIGFEETQMTVFPNPTNDFLNVQLLNVAESEGKLYLYNALGQAVYEQSILITDSKAEVQLDVQTLPIGIYTLSFQTNKTHQTHKVAKE